MADGSLCSGNEAVGKAAILAGCKHFFGYPITPQSEIAEFLSRELPKIGGVYLQSEGEGAAAYMLYGGGMTGERVMTATSSPGLALMHEAFSHIMMNHVPAVVVEVMRLGPGAGTGGQQGQTDYRMVRAGVYGGQRYFVIAPNSVKEIFEYVALAFHIADKYRILTMVLTDFVLGRMTELVNLTPGDLGPLPDKDWGLRGKALRGGKAIAAGGGFVAKGTIQGTFQHWRERWQAISDAETRYESYRTDDAEVLIAAYGSVSRMARGAVNMARAQGLKVGLFRPITICPFPMEALRQTALRAGKVLVVEDGPGEFVEDVENAAQGRVPVHFLGIEGRNLPGASGLIFPERILAEVTSLL